MLCYQMLPQLHTDLSRRQAALTTEVRKEPAEYKHVGLPRVFCAPVCRSKGWLCGWAESPLLTQGGNNQSGAALGATRGLERAKLPLLGSSLLFHPCLPRSR